MKFDLITDIDLLNMLDANTRGGFVTVVRPFEKLNNKHTPDYDPSKPSSSAIFLDFNSMYAEILCTKLPVGEIYELTPVEVSTFDLQTDCNGDHTYIVCVDTHIPDAVAQKTDDLPLILCHKNVQKSDLSEFTKGLMGDRISHPGRKLVASHEDQKEYVTALDLLQVLMRHGVEITRIHKVFRFKQEPCFDRFIHKNIENRKNASNKFEKDLYKLLSNSIFGKLLFNPRKRCEEVKLVTREETFHKHAANPLLKRCYPIGNDSVIMILGQQEITMNHPVYAGFMVLEKAKKKIYEFFYDVLKPAYGNSVSLVYSDTDSLLLKFDDVFDIEEELIKEPLIKYMDFSNMEGSALYNITREGEQLAISRQGALGLLKSETGCDYPNEIVCLQPKVYSVLLNSMFVKRAAKGVNKNVQQNLTHDLYKKIHAQTISEHSEMVCNITANKCKLYTTKTRKKCLSKVETKRYYLDGEHSLGYGHPDIEQDDAQAVSPIRKNKRSRIYNGDLDVMLDLTAKRRKPGEAVFGCVDADPVVFDL
jgi:hypothetical protein